MAQTRLAEIYQMEKARGGGLGSTLGKRAMEKIDPRQIFNQGGLLAAAFPSLFKAYKVKADKDGVKGGSKINDSGFNSLSIEGKLDSLIDDSHAIRSNSNLIAKSALVLPKIQHDTNLTRQNIARLVKLMGGKPTYKPDMFFKTALAREKDYESAFGKEKGKVDKEKESEKAKRDAEQKNTLDSLSDLTSVVKGATSGFSLLRTALAPLVGPAGLLAALGVGALYAINKMSNKLVEDAREKGGEEGAALEEQTQGEMFAGADPSGLSTNFTTGQDYTGKSLTTQDDKDLLYRKKDAEENAKKWRDWSMKNQAWQGATERAKEMKSAPTRGLVEPALSGSATSLKASMGGSSTSPTPANLGQTIASGKYNMSPEVAAMRHDQIGALSTSPSKKNPLLDLIAKGESESAGGYNAMNQGTPGGKGVIGSGNSEKIIGKKLTDMTVGELLSRGAKRGDSAEKRKKEGLIFAAGRYQIIPETLQGLVDKGIVSKNDKFDEETQDRLGMELIKGTGALKLAGQGKMADAQNALAKEWASIPLASDVTKTLKNGQKIVMKAGQSYYEQGGVNTAKAAHGKSILAALEQGSTSGDALAAATQGVNAANRQVASAGPTIINNNGGTAKGEKRTQQTASASTTDREMTNLLVGRTA